MVLFNHPRKWRPTTLCKVTSLILADGTVHNTTSYWHDNIVCLYVRLSLRAPACLWRWALAKQHILRQKCMNKWIGSVLLRTRFYNFQPFHRPHLKICTWTMPVTYLLLVDVIKRCCYCWIQYTFQLCKGRTKYDRLSQQQLHFLFL